MTFICDRQTATDLDLFEKPRGEASVFSLFNCTRSTGGKLKLEMLFAYPLSDINTLEERVSMIRYLCVNRNQLHINRENLNFTEIYLKQQNVPYRTSRLTSIRKAIYYALKPNNEYYLIQRGVKQLTDLIIYLYDFFCALDEDQLPEILENYRQTVINRVKKTRLKNVLTLRKKEKLNAQDTGRLDFYFRRKEKSSVRDLLELVYFMDAFQSVAEASVKHCFSLPTFIRNKGSFNITGLFHPFLENPVVNDFSSIPGKRVCFLTGPNMAGKSTFLKALSISVYLAHLGFPVPAANMQLPVFNGLLTTINLSDNINKGYSHFMNEIMRIKHVAAQLRINNNLFVVFDELFRGTNVKDAFDGSLSVINAFSKHEKGFFAISTHLVEVAEQLAGNENVFFNCFEARLDLEIPVYNYKIREGISKERIGLYLLKKEKVIEEIENAGKEESAGKS
ncbi:MAG: hypothetical protein EA361_18955 [Bacteroidetes bacterium]|nr:MAG: hypothetical protein EA361_18955 [Bacteroidota bacterium]